MNAYIEAITTGDRPLPVTHPHCDWRVLHSPGRCDLCDAHADWQRARADAKVLFTDDPRNKELVDAFLLTGKRSDGEHPCPAYLQRGDLCQVWAGNLPYKGMGA